MAAGRACVAWARPTRGGQGVGQTIAFDQKTPKPVKIAGWSKSEGVPGPQGYHYSLYVDFSLADGTSWPMKLATFPTGTHDWQYAETVVTPPQPIRSARFHAFLRERDGTVWFDDLFLGEVDGPNLLKCPGFEKDERVDVASRTRLVRGPGTAPLQRPAQLSEQFAGGLGRAGLGRDRSRRFPPRGAGPRNRRLAHAGHGPLPIRDAPTRTFPQFDCVNNRWGRRWTEALAKAARISTGRSFDGARRIQLEQRPT